MIIEGYEKMIKTFKCQRCQDEFENLTWDPIEKAYCPRCSIEMMPVRELNPLPIRGDTLIKYTKDDVFKIMDKKFEEYKKSERSGC